MASFITDRTLPRPEHPPKTTGPLDAVVEDLLLDAGLKTWRAPAVEPEF
jgi:hypothetical protein